MRFSKRNLEEIGSRVYLALLDSMSPINNLTSANQKRIDWGKAGAYFDGMADPYKVFDIRIPDANGNIITYRKSTAELLKIERQAYDSARNELSSILDELQNNGIVDLNNPYTSGTATVGFRDLDNPTKLLTEYPYENDVFSADPTVKIEGMAIPSSNMVPVYLTPRVFDRAVISDDAIIRFIERIYSAVHIMHVAANANPCLSPAVHIAMNRLGSTESMFNALDSTARDSLVPKTSGIPESEVLRGSWSDNRYFGDHGSDRARVYSNKNAYLPDLGNPRDTRITNLYRNGPLGDDSTRFVNPCFPEYLKPIHCVSFPNAGSPANAGFIISGPSDPRYRLALANRAAVWTYSNESIIGWTRTGTRYDNAGIAPISTYSGSGNLFGQFGPSRIAFDGTLASWANHASRLDETNGPYGVMRRLRDWYYENKPNCVVTVSDPITDFAAAIQLARFLVDMPPHVLLHSVMGYHNALLKLSFLQVNVPYSTAIEAYQQKMRMERDGIGRLAQEFGLIGHGTTEPGYALTVKPPGSVIMSDAGLQATTVASLSVATAAVAGGIAAASVATAGVGLVCIALVGIGILVAELNGGRAQNLVTPRDRSKEDLRYARNGGVRTNWIRGMTPEWVVNSIPVQRI